MNSSEIKNLISGSLKQEAEPADISALLEKNGVSYDFSRNFGDKVIDRIFSAGITVNREAEFLRSMNFVFYRIALSGVAAIIVLMISIFLMEGSLSFNSFLGLGNNYDETIVSLLTGN
jgi:hypothetical protein